MITPWTIYWITRLDGIVVMGVLGIAICFIIAVLVLLYSVMCMDGLNQKYKDYDGKDPDFLRWKKEYWGGHRLIRKVWIPISIIPIFVLLLVATPSTKEAIAIYAIPKIANNQNVQQIPENFAKLINEKLQEWMKDVDILQTEKKE